MLAHLIGFESKFFLKRISFYFLTILFIALGLAIAAKANFSFPNTFKNSPYTITYLSGLFSLAAIFIVTILVAQSLFREKDARFESILYASPVRKLPFLLSRIITITVITLLCFALFLASIFYGQKSISSNNTELGAFNSWNYIHPFLLIILPNVLLCASVACSIAWLSKNKLMVYVSGLFIYFLYMAVSLFSNSPLMAGHSPVSAESMNVAAILDPFGITAFFQHTAHWNAELRNTQTIQFEGNFCVNRLLYISISTLLLALSYYRYKFTISKTKNRINKKTAAEKYESITPSIAIEPKIKGIGYFSKSILSFVKLDIIAITKGIPFILICLGWLFFICIEIYSEVNGGSRFPERFASSSLMIKNILSTFPLICLFIILFYSSEVFWRSKAARFDHIENATPVSPSSVFISKIISLSIVTIALLSLTILLAILLQVLFSGPAINWKLYLSLYYLVAFPILLCTTLIVCINSLVNNKYFALTISTIVILLTNTSIGAMAGFNHPLLQFANAFEGNYSEMAGFENYIKAFHWKMIYWTSLTILIALISANYFSYHRFTRFRKLASITLGLALMIAVSSGFVINRNTTKLSRNEINEWKQGYEKKYNAWKMISQPTITNVITSIDLFPSKNYYEVQGSYTLHNKSALLIDEILVHCPKSINWKSLSLPNAVLVESDPNYGHRLFRLRKPLIPGDSINFQFEFNYQWSAFNKHESFNAIMENGAFMRISNYFPSFGYNVDNEIDDPKEREKRKMDAGTLLTKLDALRSDSNQHFINLDATISTNINQTAICIGEMIKSWNQDDRRFFHYKTSAPIPFRFAVASGRYEQRKARYNNIDLIAYYHPAHAQNIDHLLQSSKQSIEYFVKNFGEYPFQTLRLVEISSFTRGFAGTAYPTSFFITEDFGYKSNIKNDARRDIINELASHEISHSWWGNSSINPDEREGAKLLTETLAMYSELMIHKKMYGEEPMLDRVNIHKSIYLNERAFLTEEPLIKVNPSKSFICYDKGMVIMYQLYKSLGEEKINHALSQFYNKHRYPNPSPIASDLVRELYAVADGAQQKKIDEWFKEIIVYDIKIDSLRLQQEREQYQLSLALTAKKIKSVSDSKTSLSSINDYLEIEVYFASGKSQKLKVFGDKINLLHTFNLSERPIRVKIDPDALYLDVSDEDNEKQPG